MVQRRAVGQGVSIPCGSEGGIGVRRGGLGHHGARACGRDCAVMRAGPGR